MNKAELHEMYDHEHELRIILEQRLGRRRKELAHLHDCRAYEHETETILLHALAMEAAGFRGEAAKALKTYQDRMGPREV